MNNMPKILIIEDEEDIRDLLSYNLSKEGYETITAADGIQGRELVFSVRPDLVLLDIMLPGMDGLELCRIIRSRREIASIPIIMLTAKGEEVDKVIGLEMGADDYVTKPFGIREITARIKAIMRRSRPEASREEERFTYGTLAVDLSTHEVRVDGRLVNLSPLEFRLLRFFIGHPERVYSRDYLLDHVWGDDAYVEPRTVDVHIRRLREKIDPEGARLIKTIRGTGYKFSVRDES